MTDRKKAIKGLEEVDAYFHRMTEVCYRGDEATFCDLKEKVADAITMLKEQEGVVPYIDIDEAKCPVCKVKLTRQELIGDDVLFEDFFDYCPHCGKPVLWKGR